jgi:hypothetical protein
MTPSERDRVRTALHTYVMERHLSVHDLAAEMKAAGRKVDAKILHRYLDRGLLVDDAILDVYRGFVDLPH